MAQMLVRLALSMVAYAFIFPGTAVLVRRRLGSGVLWGGTLLLAVALAWLLSRSVSALAAAPEAFGTMAFLMAFVIIVVPTVSVAFVADRLSRRVSPPGLGRHIVLCILTFLGMAPVGMALGAAIDFCNCYDRRA